MQPKTEAPPDPLADTMSQAMREHGAGRLDAAQALYRQVLEARPQHPDALHLLGVLHAQRGLHGHAAELIEQAIAVHPREAMYHNNLGNVMVERSRFDDAEASYMRAIELDAGRLDALNNLGVLLGRRGNAEGAEKLLLRVVELSPDFADARQNLANHYMRIGRLPDAVQQCFDGLITAPRSNPLRRLLGMAYSMMGRTAEAAEVYRAWLAAEPDNAIAAYHLQACVGEAVPERAPDEYVAKVFDSFARTFDAKLADLSYQAPQLTALAVQRHLGEPGAALAVLDAGCGTGLCGPLLKPYAARLDGVDLSAGMLRMAEPRGVYDDLVCAELVAFLKQRVAAYDLIVSADTLCYFGAIEAFAAAARASLRGAGWLVFTVEAHADGDGEPGFRLHQHGRYSHRRGYVEASLRDAGLVPIELQPVVLRMEAGQPVDGWLVSARAAAH